MIPSPCQICRKKGLCRRFYDMCRLSLSLFADGKDAPDCDEQILTYQAMLAQ